MDSAPHLVGIFPFGRYVTIANVLVTIGIALRGREHSAITVLTGDLLPLVLPAWQGSPIRAQHILASRQIHRKKLHAKACWGVERILVRSVIPARGVVVKLQDH